MFQNYRDFKVAIILLTLIFNASAKAAELMRVDSNSARPIKATKEHSKYRPENIKFTSKPKVFGQHQYKILSVSNVKSTGLRLIGTDLGIKKINDELKKNHLSSIDSEISCKGGYESHLSVLNWDSTFITIRNDEIEDCGGVHANYGHLSSVYNLSSGDLEDPSLWLVEDYQNKLFGLVPDEISKDSPLGKKLSEQYVAQSLKYATNEDDIAMAKDCLGVISFFSTGSWANSANIFFNAHTSFANSPCTGYVGLPFKIAEPLLSDQGKFVMRASQK